MFFLLIMLPGHYRIKHIIFHNVMKKYIIPRLLINLLLYAYSVSRFQSITFASNLYRLMQVWPWKTLYVIKSSGPWS